MPKKRATIWDSEDVRKLEIECPYCEEMYWTECGIHAMKFEEYCLSCDRLFIINLEADGFRRLDYVDS